MGVGGLDSPLGNYEISPNCSQDIYLKDWWNLPTHILDDGSLTLLLAGGGQALKDFYLCPQKRQAHTDFIFFYRMRLKQKSEYLWGQI